MKVNPRLDPLIWITVAVCLWAAIVQGHGIYRAWTHLQGKGGFADLQQRHLELRDWEEGIYPRRNLHPPDVAVARTTVYPPSALPLLWSLAPAKEFVWNRPWFFLVSMLSLAFVAVVAWRLGWQFGWLPALLFSASTLGVFAGSGTWIFGQLGFIVNALLLAAALTLQRPHGWVASGILWALALVKPSNALFYGLAFLDRRRWVGMVAGASIIAVLTWLGLSIGGTNLSELWKSHAEPATMNFVGQGNGIPPLLVHLGFAPHFAAGSALFAGAVLGCVLLVRYRSVLDWLGMLALAATLNRLFFYHHHYDNILLVFLLLALLREAFLHRVGSPGLAVQLVAAGVALSLFAPVPPLAATSWLHLFPLFWICSLVTLLEFRSRQMPG